MYIKSHICTILRFFDYYFLFFYLCNAAIINLAYIILLGPMALSDHLIDISDLPRARVELNRHAQTTTDHVVIAGLGAKCLVCNL